MQAVSIYEAQIPDKEITLPAALAGPGHRQNLFQPGIFPAACDSSQSQAAGNTSGQTSFRERCQAFTRRKSYFSGEAMSDRTASATASGVSARVTSPVSLSKVESTRPPTG